jgi:hypothetical protein
MSQFYGFSLGKREAIEEREISSEASSSELVFLISLLCHSYI